MLYIASRKEIQEYRESIALGQSHLKKLLIGMDEFLKEDDFKQTQATIIGSAVDCILTGNEDDFDELYYESKCEKPSDTVCLILETVYEKAIDKKASLETYEGILLGVATDLEYQKKWKSDTKIRKLLEFSDYYEELQNSDGKTIISQEDMKTIYSIVDSLINSPNTAKYFNRVTPPNIDMYLQLPIYWEYEGIQCKSLLDIVIVVKDEKEDIVKVIPIDLKTFWDRTTNFLNAVKQRRYDIQAASYSLAVSKHFKVPVSNFIFVVESTTKIGSPLVFHTTDDFLEVGLKGLPEVWYENRLIRQEILGYHDLIELYKYYSKQGWQEEKIVFESAGNLKLDWEKVFGYGN